MGRGRWGRNQKEAGGKPAVGPVAATAERSACFLDPRLCRALRAAVLEEKAARASADLLDATAAGLGRWIPAALTRRARLPDLLSAGGAADTAPSFSSLLPLPTRPATATDGAATSAPQCVCERRRTPAGSAPFSQPGCTPGSGGAEERGRRRSTCRSRDLDLL